MPDTDVLLTIAEIAVTFAGFASVGVLFQHRDPASWPVSVVVRLRTMIEGSLATLFAALLPFVLNALGLAGARLWTVASLLLAAVYLAFGAVVWRRSRAAIARGELSGGFSVVVAVVTGLVLLALLLNATGIGFGLGFGAYLVGVVWTLVFASLMFLRVVVFPSGSAGPR